MDGVWVGGMEGGRDGGREWEGGDTSSIWTYELCNPIKKYRDVSSAVLCCSVLCCTLLCCAVVCYAVQCYAMLCGAILYCAVQCSTMLCSVVQWCAVLCSAIQRSALLNHCHFISLIDALSLSLSLPISSFHSLFCRLDISLNEQPARIYYMMKSSYCTALHCTAHGNALSIHPSIHPTCLLCSLCLFFYLSVCLHCIVCVYGCVCAYVRMYVCMSVCHVCVCMCVCPVCVRGRLCCVWIWMNPRSAEIILWPAEHD